MSSIGSGAENIYARYVPVYPQCVLASVCARTCKKKMYVCTCIHVSSVGKNYDVCNDIQRNSFYTIYANNE